jgi:hypothetical protein
VKAKREVNFLAQKTSEQSAKEGIPFADIEKRMMYFAENDSASCPNPLELNREFEARCDSAEYEIKTARLLHHAYERLRAEDPERVHHWDQAIRVLRKGDLSRFWT